MTNDEILGLVKRYSKAEEVHLVIGEVIAWIDGQHTRVVLKYTDGVSGGRYSVSVYDFTSGDLLATGNPEDELKDALAEVHWESVHSR